MKRITIIMICLALSAALLAGCGGTATAGSSGASASSRETASTAAVTVTEAPTTEQFSDGDVRTVSADDANATITLSGSEGTLSDSTRGSSGSVVTITSKGAYLVTGSAEGVQIVVDDSTKSGNVYLILDSVSMTNADACILVENADKVILQLSGDSTLTSTAPDKGTIYAKDDLTVNGSGSLTVLSAKHGVVCKNDLRLTGGSLSVNAESVGLKSGGTVRISDGTITLSTGHDGVQIDSDAGDGYFYMEGGAIRIDAGYDGVDVGTSESVACTGYLRITGGTLAVTAGGGSDSAKSDTSQKGLKCAGNIYLDGGAVTVSAADDAVHADGDVSVADGVLTLSSSDDGVHAAGTLAVSGGALTVSKSYEGLEAETVSVSGGTVRVTASDDGVNAAGGSDSASAEAGPWKQGGNTGVIQISGGALTVNAGGDGLDSNGSIRVSGGVTVVEASTAGGNGALDKGDGALCVCEITGGTVLALGTADMAVNFDSGSQCSALVGLSGKAGDVITVDDGSGFSYTATKAFACAVYSGPELKQGQSYTITAGASTAAMAFTNGLYYTSVSSAGGGKPGAPGMR